jgi:hypothetical protein
MTKYLVFKNETESGLFNMTGSREEMACDIAILTTGAALSKEFYIAYQSDSPNSTLEMLKEPAKFAVVIDDKRADLWMKEIEPMSRLSDEIDEAIGEAYSNIYEAARSFDLACEKSEHCKELGVLDYMGIDRAFDSFEHQSTSGIATLVEEIFSVESFEHHHA